MRLLAYAGTSTVLAAGVILRAFHQRANFYSACVYLSQSNACLMILTNLLLLLVCLTMLGLQRLLYGPLRAFEIEQLYEKAWFAITETCLAMTIFREEVGAWFLVMFVGLLVGKVWAWIGEGRVEILEQQPPANPRLFHARLSFSLLLSLVFDISMLRYAIHTVLRMARPNMMVMFAFEFAILTIASSSTAARYIVSLIELYTINKQRQVKIEERRAQLRAAQEQAASRTEDDGSGDSTSTAVREDDIDETDIDVPGWEAKGQWVFSLDLVTDFLKLVVYLSFFFILLTFYGLPIHIMRDVFLTLRSFVRRIGDFIGYRRATRDMNERYPDALPEEVAREEVCIICREEMRPWHAAGQDHDGQAADGAAGAAGAAAGAAPAPSTTWDERSRPKRLPCGHILHFACLRRWLERQQICPTCRRPVMVNGPSAVDSANRAGANQAPNQAGRAENAQQGAAAAAGPQQGGQQGRPPGNRARVFNLGPLRIGFGVGTGHVFQDVVERMQNDQAARAGNAQQQPPPMPPDGANRAQLSFGFGFARQARPAEVPATGNSNPVVPITFLPIEVQLQHIEQQLQQQTAHLRMTAEQLRVVQALHAELTRLRHLQAGLIGVQSGVAGLAQAASSVAQPPTGTPAPTVPSYSSVALPPINQPALPPGFTLPPGWTLVPLHRVANFADEAPRRSALSTTEPGPGPSRTGAETPTFLSSASGAHRHGGEGGSSSGLASSSASSGAQQRRGFSADQARVEPSDLAGQGTASSEPTDDAPRPSSHVADHADLPSPTPKSIPRWSSTGAVPFANDDGGDEDEDGHDGGFTSLGQSSRRDGPSQSSSSYGDASTSRSSKGKARAATVEDSMDAID